MDSVFELRRVADVAADLGAQARVALRVDLNVASETHPGLRTSKGAKAGIDASEALAAFGLAAQLPNIELVGMHYHIGSQITRVEPYLEALDRRSRYSTASRPLTASASSISTSAAASRSPTTTAPPTSPTRTSRRRTRWTATRRASASACRRRARTCSSTWSPGAPSPATRRSS